MFTSFNTALSALNADTTAIDVVGNNLANLNTTGYKASTVSFSDLVTESLGAGLGETQVGFGSHLRQRSPISLKGHSNVDWAARRGDSGDGFLVVQDPSTNDTLYTRGGNLIANKQGQLTTVAGDLVQGWNATANGTIDKLNHRRTSCALGTLIPPTPTANMSLTMNLDSSAALNTVILPTTPRPPRRVSPERCKCTTPLAEHIR